LLLGAWCDRKREPFEQDGRKQKRASMPPNTASSATPRNMIDRGMWYVVCRKRVEWTEESKSGFDCSTQSRLSASSLCLFRQFSRFRLAAPDRHVVGF
jgi:hypothetical protein